MDRHRKRFALPGAKIQAVENEAQEALDIVGGQGSPPAIWSRIPLKKVAFWREIFGFGVNGMGTHNGDTTVMSISEQLCNFSEVAVSPIANQEQFALLLCLFPLRQEQLQVDHSFFFGRLPILLDKIRTHLEAVSAHL